ncbi:MULTISPECIES: sensor histidine kinase [Agrobacterium tumefaciens complex]|uniref:sensor histidine kinase n=1 Tax=Agrobacterium tumefaciens complex TaxID=1183400 RepID=UPI00036AF5F4|nr:MULTISPECIES: histidine kinase dimerization/phosphoacceptor domain -containing protein [Agrobacterium tumefaciens complex]EPR23430.1 histidine kinase [Agrobacterium radiobacter DSM 30147]KAB0459184.1 PAS domain-containing protein [Agrobacterium tumefaciens]KWT75389.1 histidine kinase [Agrobacterium radiobacter]MBB4409313.1 two-component sensor histidine kinase [Agrobacterium radiobacter]MBB4454178.1 two-component sensor histidine kinase [Agrobacterium radiobacter]
MSQTPIVHFEAPSTLAMVMSSNEPLLFLSDDLKIIAASASFCRAFEIPPASVRGKRLAELGHGEWAMAKLESLLTATVTGSANIDAYEIDLKRPDQKTRQLIINARTLDDGDLEHIRLLVAITDVTDMRVEARLKDDLVRDKAILLQEVQHRVANSLQIIASVLMQSARRVQSEEARGHLHDARHRIMSIAALQRQLSTSAGGNVELRTYLTQLCQSLGASMIADPERLSIRVTVDDSSVPADVSISLGLIVTELVINALKHAFTDERTGLIEIDYQSSGQDWTLSITDNGIGMPVGSDAPKAGLGTGIVEALVKNLEGEITLTDADPGTVVTVTRRQTPGLLTEVSPAA